VAFVVNGADWNFGGMSASEVEKVIDRALAFVDVSIARGEEVWIGDDFQARPMYGASAIWDLFADDSPIRLRGEISQELAAWLGRARRYADTDEWPDGVEDAWVSIDHAAPVENADVAWVHHCIRAGTAAACFTLGASAIVETTTAAGTATLHFVGDEAGRRRFWREVIVIEGDNTESLIRNSPHAHPDLHFIDGVLWGVDRLSGGYLASRHRVRAALAALDDWGHWVFSCPPPAMTPHEEVLPDAGGRPGNLLIQNRLAGVGVTAAPENPDVRKHRVSREARETIIGARTLYCEWHVKLEAHQNRIHFHGPIPESGDKVVVGMIDAHLPLP
jgi:hypothetical protein